MNFAEFRFWGIMAAGLGAIYAIRILVARRSEDAVIRFDKAALMVLGIALLFAVNILSCALFVAVTVASHRSMAWILSRPKGRRHRHMIWLVPLQLTPLCLFKYADFFVNGVLGLPAPYFAGWGIPVGISFYTFQQVSFAVDTIARGARLPRMVDYVNFAGFFPQIVAGPIERRADLLPQIERFRFRWSARDIDAGAGWIVLGLFFKLCLANNVSSSVAFGRGFDDNAFAIWLTNVLFGLQIYLDFAGYSLTALGLGRCFGLRLTLNFRSPYLALSLREFWRRWHVTLSQWFRDYVYIPLGGGRARWWGGALMAVFLASGVWHGAGWNFVLWGAAHGLLLVAARLWRRKRLPAPAALACTWLAVAWTWLFFYETNMARLWAKLTTLCEPASYRPSEAMAFFGVMNPADLITLAGVLGLCLGALMLEWLSLRGGGEPYGWLRKRWVSAMLATLTVWLAPAEKNDFIYFAF